MFFVYALALLRGVSARLARFGRAFEQVADEAVEDAPGFWRKHRAKLAILVVSAVTSGLATYIGERLSGPL